MKVSCPKCFQQISLDTEAMEPLEGVLGFDCPACGCHVPLPAEPGPGAPTEFQVTPAVEAVGAPAQAPAESSFGTRYQIRRVLGRGGMGTVFEGFDTRLDRRVAIKILQETISQDPGMLARFEREAKAMAALDHPNIVRIHDYGQTDEGNPFLVMEFIDGMDVHRLHASGQLDLPGALGLVSQVCSALHYAHSRGIVHRDIKPANILVTQEGLAKVVDFGLAKVLGTDNRPQPESRLTRGDLGMGTPDYTAPEQLQGQPVDHRADIYSLGVMLYELLTGVPPRGAWPPPSECVHIDIRLDEIVLRALQLKPSARYQAASEVRDDIDSVKSSTGGEPIPPGVDPEPLPSASQSAKVSPERHTTVAPGGTNPPPTPASAADLRPAPSAILAKAHRGLNRNLLLLGIVTLFLLGGLGFFLTNRDGGIFHTEQRITKEIINNTYFQNLIASGKASTNDLDALTLVRPYGDGFIGASKDDFDWLGALVFARRTGSVVLAEDTGGVEPTSLITWLSETFTSQRESSFWMDSQGKPCLFTGRDFAIVKQAGDRHKVLLHWRPATEGSALASGNTPAKDPKNSTRTIPADDILLHYDFTDGSGTTVTDKSGHARHGTLVGFDTATSGAGDGAAPSGWMKDGGLMFDGVDDKVQTPLAVSDVAAGSGITIEAIAGHRDIGRIPWATLIATDARDLSEAGVFLIGKNSPAYSEGPPSGLNWRLHGLVPKSARWMKPTAIGDGSPHHLALVYDTKGRNISLFFDHQLLSQETDVTGKLTIANRVQIGANGWLPDEGWFGPIHEIRITRCPLAVNDFLPLPTK